MKPQNMLVFRNQQVKFGDFGVSLTVKDGKDSYKLKGLSPEWSMPEIKDLYKQGPEKMWDYRFTLK